MTATNHALAGAIIGASISNPFLALPLALASHLALDVTPHFGSKEYTSKRFIAVLVVDFILTIALLLTILVMQPANVWLIVAAGFVAYSPDLLWIPMWVAKMQGRAYKFSKVKKFLVNIQWGEFRWGLLVEIPFALFLTKTLFQIV